MEETHIILNVAVALAVAFVGGVLARRAGLPVIVGYLLAGLAVGPSTPGFDADLETVLVMAEFGVAFLMFSLGVEFSLRELLEVRRIAIGGGALQVTLSIVLGGLIALVLGWNWTAAILFGMIVALSSSIVAVKLLLLRGEATTRHGRITAGLAVFQDLSLVPMLVVLPLLSGSEGNVFVALIRSLGTAIAVLAAVVFLGLRLVPWTLERVAASASRELFLLAVVVIALGTAIGTEAAGLSLALGAFLAGLVVSESDFSHQVLADIIPLREAFATLFFVSIGMLLDFQFLVDHAFSVAIVITVIIVGKFLILLGTVRAFGVASGSAVLVAVLLAQIGEFSFILASEGRDRGLLTLSDYRLVLAASAGTMLISPIIAAGAPRAIRIANRFNARWHPEPLELEIKGEPMSRHTIVCGYGRLGAELTGALQRRGFACVVVDSDPAAVRQARDDGFPALYGDVGSPEVLHRLGIERARVLAIAVNDPFAAEAAVEIGRHANPRLDIVARARSREQMHRLRELGATEVIQPEFEAGLELIRHTLHVHGLDNRQVSAIVQGRRESYYALDDDE